MRGNTVVSTGIEYHERHSVEPDTPVPARFGKALEIPEDLVPIPPDIRPTAIRAGHPLARYVTVIEHTTDPDGKAWERPLHNAVFFDQAAGVVVELRTMDTLPDGFGVHAERARSGLVLEVRYDEEAIRRENHRRLTKAMECAAFYAAVIDQHQERIAREKAEREAKEAEQAAAAGSPVSEPLPEQTNGDPSQK
jgi:hypothetical protein